MIAISPHSNQHATPAASRWQLALSRAITDPAELLRQLDLDPDLLGPAREAAEKFRLKAPHGFIARMRKGDPDDPLLRQVLPLGAELTEVEGYSGDPVGDLDSAQAQGVLHKYRGRALIVATGACAVHCRYCFRREFPYSEHPAAASDWSAPLTTLAGDASIREVILSGGDPLSLADHKLRSLTDGLSRIPHIERLRIHTRFPVVLPERVDEGLRHWLSGVRLRKVVVIHANHPNEIDASVERALEGLRGCDVTLLNQSVLLKGVNDTAEALVRLSERLFAAGVLPYYLHSLDRVRGAAHFNVDPRRAARLMRDMASRLPGYLVPRWVREQAGAPYKLPQHW